MSHDDWMLLRDLGVGLLIGLAGILLGSALYILLGGQG